jgi:predicted kinase
MASRSWDRSHDEATRERLEVLFWHVAQRILILGTSVILESGFWLRSDRDEKRIRARALGAAVTLHYLDVPIDELWRRIGLRKAVGGWGAAPITWDQLETWARYFEAPDPEELAFFDTPWERSP